MSRFTINNVLKQIEKLNNPFSFLTADNSQNNNSYDEKILTLIDHLKTIPDNKKKIDYLNYFLESNESKELKDFFSFIISDNGLKTEMPTFINEIKKNEGIISYITRITKDEDYSIYRRMFFYSYIAIYEKIKFENETSDTAHATDSVKQEEFSKNRRGNHITFNEKRQRILKEAAISHKARYTSIEEIERGSYIDVHSMQDARIIMFLFGLDNGDIENNNTVNYKRIQAYFTINGKIIADDEREKAPSNRKNQNKEIEKAAEAFKKEIAL